MITSLYSDAVRDIAKSIHEHPGKPIVILGRNAAEADGLASSLLGGVNMALLGVLDMVQLEFLERGTVEGVAYNRAYVYNRVTPVLIRSWEHTPFLDGMEVSVIVTDYVMWGSAHFQEAWTWIQTRARVGMKTCHLI